MAVVQMRLNVVYQGDFKLSLLLTYGALPGVGTIPLQQLLDFIINIFVDIVKYQIFQTVSSFSLFCGLVLNDSFSFLFIIEPRPSPVAAALLSFFSVFLCFSDL